MTGAGKTANGSKFPFFKLEDVGHSASKRGPLLSVVVLVVLVTVLANLL